MAISDYLWPFEKKFSKIPCAREAAIFGMTGGPILAGLVLIYDKKPKLVVQRAVTSGLVLFWIAFLSCRTQNVRLQNATAEFKESLEKGKFD